jgi:uroporphyrin-III C-methyltransferase/precorrin-2 dehydrogenase/sirohydrochlorin ferrochelatase
MADHGKIRGAFNDEQFEAFCAELRAHGLPPDWPAAVVSDGTSPAQRVIAATLDTLPEAVAAAELHGPTLLMVGEVVKLREKLDWFRGRAVAGG